MEILSMLLLILPLAIAPGIAISLFVYFRDKYEKEPFRLLLFCFLFGLLSIVPALIIELSADATGINTQHGPVVTFIYAFFIVALSEEMSKYFFLRVYAYRRKEFNEPFDGIVYSVMISMGFATLENIFYAISGGLSTTMLRMFTAVPLHASCAILMGYFVGLAKFRTSPALYMFLGILFAVLLHGIYDFFLFINDIPALAIIAFVSLSGGIFLSFVSMHKSAKMSPFKNKPQQSDAENEGPAASAD